MKVPRHKVIEALISILLKLTWWHRIQLQQVLDLNLQQTESPVADHIKSSLSFLNVGFLSLYISIFQYFFIQILFKLCNMQINIYLKHLESCFTPVSKPGRVRRSKMTLWPAAQCISVFQMEKPKKTDPYWISLWMVDLSTISDI